MLAEQILLAKARAWEARAQGKEVRGIEAILRSLRRTLGCLVQFRDPREVVRQGVSLVVPSPGEVQVQHRERVLPISGSWLQSLLGEAGVELDRGQVLLLDEALAVGLVEEALGALSREEAGIRDAKSQLIAASLGLGSREEKGSPVSGRHPPEAT
jgi:hypothetical protein